MNKARKHFFAFIRNNFIAGITLLLPVFGVYLVVKFIVEKVNEVLLNPILSFVQPMLTGADIRFLIVFVKLMILFLILGAIIMIGLLAKIFFIKKILNFGESLLMRVPIINKIYTAIQQISKTFLIKKQGVFNRAVLIEYPRKGIFVPGLVTSEVSGEIQKKTSKDLVSVFVPTTPNPTSGFLLFVPREELIELDMSIEDCMKLTISFGGVSPEWESVDE